MIKTDMYDEIALKIKKLEKENAKLKKELQNERALNEIAEFCRECPLYDGCCEEECVLYRIEKILNDGNTNYSK